MFIAYYMRKFQRSVLQLSCINVPFRSPASTPAQVASQSRVRYLQAIFSIEFANIFAGSLYQRIFSERA
jgi:hypothetical protein